MKYYLIHTKVSSAREASEFLDSDYDENDIYQVEKLVLKILKKNLNDVSVHLNANVKNHMVLKIDMI